MKERPILFTPENVRKIIDGKKNQTRRVIQHRQEDEINAISKVDEVGGVTMWQAFNVVAEDDAQPVGEPFHCRYGEVGDQLWVREAFAADVPGCEAQHGYTYRADHLDQCGDGPAAPIRWRPSIHMPRKVCRLHLPITEIRAELLDNISEEDAIADGFKYWNCGHPECFDDEGNEGMHYGPRASMMESWNKINPKWEWIPNIMSPWVWAITYEVIFDG